MKGSWIFDNTDGRVHLDPVPDVFQEGLDVLTETGRQSVWTQWDEDGIPTNIVMLSTLEGPIAVLTWICQHCGQLESATFRYVADEPFQFPVALGAV